MKNLTHYKLVFVLLIIVLGRDANAQNPIIRDQFSADPTARVYDGKVYVYPSHDIRAVEGKGRPGWFCMEDYHVFSSENLTDWTDHGVIVHQERVPWVNPKGYSMWAPDCISKNGKYYFYFPAGAKDTSYGRGFCIGVAVADHPYGPFIPEPAPIKGARGIDPNVFVDKDGQAYLYWSGRGFSVAKLKDNMIELASEPQMIPDLPQKGLKEGPFLFERNGKYYLTYPHVENKTERLEYAIGDSPMGPFKVTGVIMDEHPNGCWTNHQSIVEFKNQWYLFYHQNDYSPSFDKNRSVRVDSLFFNEDGTIQKVIPSLRGVGVTKATDKIQIDRYSDISENGVSIAFHDTLKRFDGWKTIFDSKDAWLQFNNVDFGRKVGKLNIRALSNTGGAIQICLDKVDGPIIAELKIPKSTDWKTIDTKLRKYVPGIHNIVIKVTGNLRQQMEVDWISFE